MSTIECIVKGASVEPYRYQRGIHPSKVAQKVASLKERMKRKRPVEYYKGLVPSLVQHGYLMQDTIKAKHEFAVSQYCMPFSAYRILCRIHFSCITRLYLHN